MKFKNYIETESGIKDTSTSPGTAGQLLSSTVAGTSWIDQNTISSGTSEVVDIQVKNISLPNGGINLSKGDPVYIYGSVGASPRLLVDLADADSTATNNLSDSKMPCVALLDQDLAPNIEGTATVVGKLRNLITSPIDGVTPSENDTVYVKSGGGLTLIKPTGSTNLIQNVGQVGRVSTSADGNIVVAALLRTNDVPNLPTGRLFVGTAANTSLASDVVYVDDANDRVGIGTDVPTTPLHIDIGTNDTGILVESSNTFSRIQLKDQFGEASIAALASNLLFSTATNFAEMMRLTNNGNLGIGQTGPQERLTVSQGTGNVAIQIHAYNSAAGTEAALKFSTFASTASYVKAAIIARNTAGSFGRSDMHFALDSAADGGNVQLSDTKMIILNGGNVGIGTTSPGTYKLAVAGSTAIGGNVEVTDGLGGDKLLTLNTSNGSFNIGDIDGLGDQAFISGDSSSIEISVNQSTSLYCDSNNRVGINEAIPTQRLHVSGNARVTGAYYDSNNNPGTSGQILSSTVNGTDWIDGSAIPGVPAGSGTVNYLAKWTPDANTLGIGVTYDNGTNVGIGTNGPSAKLEVVGTTGVIVDSGTSSGALLTLKGDGSSFGGGGQINIVGGSSDFAYYSLNLYNSPNTLDATNQYQQGFGSSWSWDENIRGFRAQPYTSYDFKSQGSSQMVIYNNNVGIGTTNPTAILHVEGSKDGPVAEESRAIVIGNNTKSNAFYNNGIGVFGKTIQSNGMAIHGDAATGGGFGGYFTGRGYFSGNVGIGTTNPGTGAPAGTKLHVIGGIHSSTFVNAANGLGIYSTSMGSGRGLSLYGGAQLYPQYGMLFATTSDLGNHGGVTGDFATYMTMTGSGRGWVWKSGSVNSTSGNVASINVSGALTLNSTATATNFILSSDETLKDNIKEIDVKHTDVNWKNFELKSEPGIKRAGVVAQELEVKHPEFVRTASDGIKSVAYIDLLITKIAELEARLEKAGL